MVRRSGIEGAEHQIPKMERRCGVRNSPPDGAEVRCAEHRIRVRCPALSKFNVEKFCEDLDFNPNNFFSNQPSLNKETYNLLFNHFTRIILSTIDTHAPLKPLSRKQKKFKVNPG